MERTLSVNYPVLRQNKRVLLNMFGKHHGRKIQHCTSIQEARRDIQIECTERIIMQFFTNIFNNTRLFCLSTGQFIYLISSLSPNQRKGRVLLYSYMVGGGSTVQYSPQNQFSHFRLNFTYYFYMHLIMKIMNREVIYGHFRKKCKLIFMFPSKLNFFSRNACSIARFQAEVRPHFHPQHSPR